MSKNLIVPIGYGVVYATVRSVSTDSTARLNSPRHLPEYSGNAFDNKSRQRQNSFLIEVEVIDDLAAATVALEPVRSRLLSELAEPASAAMLAMRLGVTRQRVNYHLRALGGSV